MHELLRAYRELSFIDKILLGIAHGSITGAMVLGFTWLCGQLLNLW